MRDRNLWLVFPPTIWLISLIVAPLIIILIFSFLTKGLYGGVEWTFSTENFQRLTDSLYLKIYFRSFLLASMTTVSCLVLGFPIAWVMATANSSRLRLSLLILVLIPFWTNFVVRTYALRFLVSPQGPLQSVFGWSLNLTATNELVAIGMIMNYLPFMVIPLFVTLDRMDFSLLEASKDLGATGSATFWKVIWPLSRPGWIGGCMFVFVPALGEFLIPDILGGARTMFLGNLISEQFLRARDWPFGAAVAFVLVISALTAFLVETKLRKDA